MLSRPGEIQTATISGENVDVAITIVGHPDTRHHLSLVTWSYSGTPTGGALGVTVNGESRMDPHPITTAGPGVFNLNVRGELDEPIVVTLTAGGSGVVGVLYAEFF